MNKETFLEELQQHLRILEAQEQQDILEEYAQHIDMKMLKGLSEEEAIRDFGPVQELAAGILSAYHVNPEFEETNKKKKLPDFAKAAEESKKAGISAGGWIKRKSLAIWNGIRRGVHLAAENCRKFFGKVKTLFQKGFSGNRGEESLEQRKLKEEKRMKEHGRTAEESWGKRALTVAGSGLKKTLQGLLLLGKWCLILLWNALWLFLSVMCGLFALAALFGFGALMILMLQGYPLVGIVLADFGTLLCSGVLSVWCFSLIWRKKKETPAEPELEEEYNEQTA